MAMGWGLGIHFPPSFPKFTASCRKEDFDAAAGESKISTWREIRNQASVHLFQNAARVLGNPSVYDVTQTYHPRVLMDAITVNA
jgi:hypothetical protein